MAGLLSRWASEHSRRGVIVIVGDRNAIGRKERRISGHVRRAIPKARYIHDAPKPRRAAEVLVSTDRDRRRGGQRRSGLEILVANRDKSVRRAQASAVVRRHIVVIH